MPNPKRLWAWVSAVGLIGAIGVPMSAVAADSDETAIEEIVVTGSYIKRDSFDSASPLTVISGADIELNATTNLGEVLYDMPFNYGSSVQTNTFAARSQGSASTTANLRGLGPRATLNLVDGKRTIQGNLNSFVPQIAIARMDVLKDGASALYGTDAVAGVINIITRKDFSGMKASFFYTEDESGNLTEEVYDFIMGSDTENGHITIAGAYKTRGELELIERPDFARAQWSKSGTGNPGTWAVPNRDAAGQLDGTSTRTPDPGCGVADGPGGKDQGKRFNYLSGQLSGSTCQFHFGETWSYMNPHDQVSFWANYQYEFSDNLRNELDITFLQLITTSRGSPQNPGGRIEEFPIFLGDHPGNPFRAFSDLNGNGAIDDGERLFAQDADGDGVPDRGTQDLNNDGEFDVILAASPFVQGATDVPFNEDVDVIALRALGKIGLLAGANQPSGLNADGSNNGNRDYDERNWRVANTLTWTIPDTSWEVDGTVIYQEENFIFQTKNSSQSRLELGIRGLLDPDPDPSIGAQYWNPFSTQALACVDRVCTHTGTPDAPNSVALLDSVHFNGRNIFDTTFQSYSVIGTGDLWELPNGMLQSAFGAEYRVLKFTSTQGPGENSCDWHEGGCELDWEARRDVYAAFFEVYVPVLDNLEVNIAGRYTDYGGGIGDSFDPKISFLYQPFDILSVRASFSSAFIAPSLNQQFAAENCGLQTMVDPLTNDFQATFRVRCLTGNANLTPETADVFNVGFSLSLLGGDLNLGLDYTNYDFEDRIAETTGQAVIDQDLQRFNALGFDVMNPTDVANWIGPNKGTANGETTNLIRDTTGVLTRVLAGRINAQTMEHTSWDLYGRYNLATEGFGTFVFTVNATFAEEFLYDLGIGAAGKGDGAGRQNETIVEVPPVPEWRANGNVNWFMGNHSALVRVRWIDEFKQDIAFFGAFNPPTIESMTYTDVSYSYTWNELWGDRTTKVEIGARNVFDEFPTPIFNLGGIESFVHDIRGRMLYLRVNQDI